MCDIIGRALFFNTWLKIFWKYIIWYLHFLLGTDIKQTMYETSAEQLQLQMVFFARLRLILISIFNERKKLLLLNFNQIKTNKYISF